MKLIFFFLYLINKKIKDYERYQLIFIELTCNTAKEFMIEL